MRDRFYSDLGQALTAQEEVYSDEVVAAIEPVDPNAADFDIVMNEGGTDIVQSVAVDYYPNKTVYEGEVVCGDDVAQYLQDRYGDGIPQVQDEGSNVDYMYRRDYLVAQDQAQAATDEQTDYLVTIPEEQMYDQTKQTMLAQFTALPITLKVAAVVAAYYALNLLPKPLTIGLAAIVLTNEFEKK